jgi:hypothetical protein
MKSAFQQGSGLLSFVSSMNRLSIYKGLLFGLISCCSISSGICQSVNLSDSLRKVFQEKPSLTAKFDGHNAMVSGRNSRTQSIKVGVLFGKRLSVGVGYNWLSTDIEQLLDDQTKLGYVKLRYIAPFAEYVFFRKGNWEGTMPIQLGVGKSFLSSTDRPGGSRQFENWIWLYEPTMSIEYKVAGVLGLGVGGGYRILLKNNEALDTRFTSPIYVWRIRLLFEEIRKKVNLKLPNEE